MRDLPFEIINIILSFREKHFLSNIINNLIKNFYEKDFDPNYAEYWFDNYCYHYSFSQWYFYVIRKRCVHRSIFYELTPKILNIGNEEIIG